jgi:hypothetical protein
MFTASVCEPGLYVRTMFSGSVAATGDWTYPNINTKERIVTIDKEILRELIRFTSEELSLDIINIF